MRQSYLKNAALLTVSDVGLRLAGMGLRIYLANVLGGEGMGLYQLVLAVYSLFVTLATSGVSVASTRLMAEELTGSPARAKGMLLRLCGMAAALGGAAMGAQWILAEPAARWWLGDARAAAALRAGLPGERAAALLGCNTTEDALQALSARERGQVTGSLLEKIHEYLNIRAESCAGRGMKTGAILFSNVYGLLGMTRYGEELLARGREK